MVGKAGEGQGANPVFGQPSSNQLTHGTLQKRDQMVKVSWESNSLQAGKLSNITVNVNEIFVV